MAEVTRPAPFRDKRLARVALAAAVVGFAVLGYGTTQASRAVSFAYLAAFSFVTSIALGALIFLMVTHVIGATWHVALRRLNESIVSVFPALALLFIPIALSLPALYPWAGTTSGLSPHEHELMAHKQHYLNAPFFFARAVLYFTVWTLCAALLRHWSFATDRADPGERQTDAARVRSRTLSAALLPLVALTLTFAAFDWLMSLQPFWFSTIFGVYYFAGGFVAAFGLLSLVSHFAERQAAKTLIRAPHFHALGRLMFGFTIFWAYCAFFQALLIRIADKPDEIEFYVVRLEHGWQYIALLLFAGHFVIPFLILLPRAIKMRGAWMASIGGWIVLYHYLDIYWLVRPMLDGRGALPNLWDVCALLAITGSSVAFAAWRLQGKQLVPIGDPTLARSIDYRSPL